MKRHNNIPKEQRKSFRKFALPNQRIASEQILIHHTTKSGNNYAPIARLNPKSWTGQIQSYISLLPRSVGRSKHHPAVASHGQIHHNQF